MASAIGGGNYFSNINSQLAAKGPDAAAVDNARQASGDVGQKAHDNKATDHHEGVRFSPKALQAMHQEAIQGHEHELMHEAGIQEETPDNAERQEIRKERANENYQHQVAKEGEGEGYVTVQSPTGAEQNLTTEQNERLEHMDDFDRHDPLADVPQANLEAAEKVFASQASQGLKQVAKLKPVPEAENIAEVPQESLAPKLSEPMGIVEPGTDKTTRPVHHELPEEMHQVASEQAAQQLQAGAAADEQIIAGAAAPSTNGKAGIDPARMTEIRGQRDEAKKYIDDTLKNLIPNYDKLRKGLGQQAQDLIAQHEHEFNDALGGQNGAQVSPELVHYAAIGQAAQDNLNAYCQINPAVAQLYQRHSQNGMLDLGGFCNEAQLIAKQAAQRGDKDTAFSFEDATYSAALVAASSRYLDTSAQLTEQGELPGPLNAIQHGKVNLGQASASPTHGPTVEGYRNLTPDQAWQARQSGGEALQWAYQRLDPQQQAAIQARVDRRIESGFADDDPKAEAEKKKREADHSMIWADEMEQWAAETAAQQAADDPQRTLVDMVHNQAQSYILLRNVMDERGWG